MLTFRQSSFTFLQSLYIEVTFLAMITTSGREESVMTVNSFLMILCQALDNKHVKAAMVNNRHKKNNTTIHIQKTQPSFLAVSAVDNPRERPYITIK